MLRFLREILPDINIFNYPERLKTRAEILFKKSLSDPTWVNKKPKIFNFSKKVHDFLTKDAMAPYLVQDVLAKCFGTECFGFFFN